MLAAKLRRALVDRSVIERAGSLEKHVLREVGDPRRTVIEPGSRSRAKGDSGERTSATLEDHPERPDPKRLQALSRHSLREMTQTEKTRYGSSPGRITVKVDPSPGRLSTRILPP